MRASAVPGSLPVKAAGALRGLGPEFAVEVSASRLRLQWKRRSVGAGLVAVAFLPPPSVVHVVLVVGVCAVAVVLLAGACGLLRLRSVVRDELSSRPIVQGHLPPPRGAIRAPQMPAHCLQERRGVHGRHHNMTLMEPVCTSRRRSIVPHDTVRQH